MAFESLSDKLSAAFKKLRGKGRLTAADVKEAMKEVRMALLEADVSYKVVKEFTKSVTERASGADVLEALSPAQQVIKIVNEELVKLMGSENQRLTIGSKSPSIVMLVGLQGAGKTTNGAKLAAYMRKQGKRPLLAACDIYRPAAIKQLETVGKQLDIPVFRMGTTNPVDIAKAAVEHARKHGNDLVFLDTAGRLHIDEELMQELRDKPLTQIGTHKVDYTRDYMPGTRTCMADGKSEPMELKGQNVMYYELEGGTTFIIRPSGTEPKVKVYIMANGKEKAEVDAKIEKYAAAAKEIVK
mgnify:CR=1 FL=1